MPYWFSNAFSKKKKTASAPGGGGGTPIDYYNTETTKLTGLPKNKTVTPDDLSRTETDLSSTKRDISARADFNSTRTLAVTNLSVARLKSHNFDIPKRWEKYGSMSNRVEWTLTIKRPTHTAGGAGITNYRVATVISSVITRSGGDTTTRILTSPETPDITGDHIIKFTNATKRDTTITNIAYKIDCTYSTTTTSAQPHRYNCQIIVSPAYVHVIPTEGFMGEVISVSERKPRATDQLLLYQGFPDSKPVYSSRLINLPGFPPPFETETEYEQLAVSQADVDIELKGSDPEKGMWQGETTGMSFISDVASTTDFGVYKYSFEITGTGDLQLLENAATKRSHSAGTFEDEIAFSKAHFETSGSNLRIKIGWKNIGQLAQEIRIRGRHEFRSYKRKSGMSYPGYEQLVSTATDFSPTSYAVTYVNFSRRIYVDDFREIIVFLLLQKVRGIVFLEPLTYEGAFSSGSANSKKHAYAGLLNTKIFYYDHNNTTLGSSDPRHIRARIAVDQKSSTLTGQSDRLTLTMVRNKTSSTGTMSPAKVLDVWGKK